MSAAAACRAHIALGSNVGDRAEALHTALALLDDDERTRVVAVSQLYDTAPVGGPPQGRYLNAAAVLETSRSPRALLDLMLATETQMGRVRAERWGPRRIDLDIILYADLVIDVPGLSVPHPRARERAFVLAPLVDVDPDAVFPDGTRAADVLETLARDDLAIVPEPPGGTTPAGERQS